MPRAFYSVNVHNRVKLNKPLPFEWGIELPPTKFDDATKPKAPYTDHKGVKRYPIQFPVDDYHHAALGKFMDAWSGMEITTDFVFGKLFGTDGSKTQLVVAALGTRSLVDVLTALGVLGLSNDLAIELGKTMERLKALNTKRNKLVHGVWTLEAIVDVINQEPRVRCRLYRYYQPTDPVKSKQIADLKNQKVRGEHLFTVKHIENLTKAVDQLRSDLGDFLKKAFPREKGNEFYQQIINCKIMSPLTVATVS